MFSMDYMQENYLDFWFSLDKHISKDELLLKINEKRCYIIKDDEKPVGVFRYNLFWDNIPFLNLIYLEHGCQRNGFGKKAMLYWEEKMKEQGFKAVMTSTMAGEDSQHFYRKLGYKDCGCLVMDNFPVTDSMEIFMVKKL